MDSALLDTAVVHGLCYLVALAAAVWILGPGVMYALGKRELAAETNEDTAGAEPNPGDPDYERSYRQLYALGYRPAGTMFEVARFITPLIWRYRSELQRWMVSADRKTWVVFFRIPSKSTLWFYAMTIFEGGGAVRTAYKPAKQNPSPGGNYKYFELLKTTPAELVEEHRQNVAEFSEERGLAARRATLREISDEDIALTRRVIPPSMTTGMYVVIASMYLMPALPFLKLLAKRPDFAPWWMHTSVGLCLASAIFATVRWMIVPSRVPMAIRTLALAAVVAVPPLAMIRRADAQDGSLRAISAALDQLESDVDQGLPVEAAIDRVVATGVRACRTTMKRMALPTATPARKQALHQTLIKLHGSDLGDSYEAWLPWCREAVRRR